MMLPVGLLLGLVAVAAAVVGVARRPTGMPQHADRGLRHDRVVQSLALGAAVLTAALGALWAMESSTVRGGLAIPLAGELGAGVGYLAVLAVGQLAWPRPPGPQRRAQLTARGVRDVTGTWSSRLITCPLLVVGLAVVLPAWLAPLDGPSAGDGDIYRARWDQPAGAVLTVRHVLGLPWPGLRYGVPVTVAVVVLLVLAGVALRAVADRATVADVDSAWDRAARATVARRITAVTAGVLATVGGTLVLTAGSRLVETETGGRAAAGGVLLAAGTAWAAAGFLLAVVGVVWPGRAARDPAAASSRG